MSYISVDCCGNEFEVTPCCRTPIYLQYTIQEDSITFTAFGDCDEPIKLYRNDVFVADLTAEVPYVYPEARCGDNNFHIESCGISTDDVAISIGCEAEFVISYDIAFEDTPNPEITFTYSIDCPGGSVSLMWRFLGGAWNQIPGISSPYLFVMGCGLKFEFQLLYSSPCGIEYDIYSDIIPIINPQCPCDTGITELFKITGDCDRCVDILLTGVVAPTTVDIYKRPSSFPTFSYVGSWSSNPFTDCNVTKLEDYVYKLVYKGLNCAEVSTETDVTVTYESCCQSCIVSLVDHETYVEVIFNGECCPGTTQRVYRSDGVNPEVDLGPYTVPFYDTSIEFGTTYTYRVETTGECNTSSCSDDITTQCLLIINSNTGDQDLGTIPPSIFVVTFNITVPDCCVPGTLFFSDTSPFIVLGTASTPLIAGTNPYIVAGNIVGAPVGPGAGSVVITASCPFTTASSVNDAVLISWDQT